MAELTARDVAFRLVSEGYHVIPVIPRTKAADGKAWTELRISARTFNAYFPEGADLGVGLLTGTQVGPECYIVAIDIDVDDKDLIERVGLAFTDVPPAKFGSKGRTYFAQVPHPMKKRILKRKDKVSGQSFPLIEILASGQQTVLPPSTHPKGMKYQWVGTPLTEYEPQRLPTLSEQALNEIELAVKKPQSPIFGLNTMQWLGEEGGGDIHNTTLAAVAALVAEGWEDDAIWRRVDRATCRAVLSFGEAYDWPGWEEQVRGMIASAREKKFDEKPKKEKIHITVAKWFMYNYVGADKVYTRDGRIACYKDGSFDLREDDYLRHLIATKYPEPPTVSLHSPDWGLIVANVRDMSPRFPEFIPKRRVCLMNGTFDMDERELHEWAIDDYLISRLPFGYDPNATCPTYDKFIDDTFSLPEPGETERCVGVYEEYVAHTLFECTDYHKFLVLKGIPRTGKSTLVEIARMMHGPFAVSAVPVHEFGNERYRTAMVGKLLNVVTEIAATSHAADDFLKSVTSGDSVQVRYLYQEPQLVKLPTRLLIACNNMFRIRDTSGAVEARMLILPCDNYLPEEKRDKQLLSKLRLELPGIFNRLVEAWQRLRARGHFDPPKIQQKSLDAFTLENNHCLQWLIERTIQGRTLEDPQFQIPGGLNHTEVSQLYLDYVEWAKLNGFKNISSITFGMKLSEAARGKLDVDTKLKSVHGSMARVRPLTLVHKAGY